MKYKLFRIDTIFDSSSATYGQLKLCWNKFKVRFETLDFWEPIINRILVLTYEIEFVLSLAVLENFVLPMGRESSHKTLKVMSIDYKYSLCAVSKNAE